MCLETDILHQAAMEATGCECMDLSTPTTSIHYHIEGDFCHGNSGRILCRVLERCGIWNCRIGDFMCPRHEYNTLYIPYAGKGDCTGAATTTTALSGTVVLVVLALSTAYLSIFA